jgi:hypothetical protein
MPSSPIKSKTIDTPYFNPYKLDASPHYVARIDMMGARAAMTRSLTVSARFIGKLHVAMLQAPRDNVAALVPTIDGAYIACEKRDDLLDVMRSVFRSLAASFVAEKNRYHQFLIRGGIAYGPIVLGSSISKTESTLLAKPLNHSYRDAILLGIPVVQAYEVEADAPPFGIGVHVSARAFAPEESKPFNSTFWKWLDKKRTTDNELFGQLKYALDHYYSFMQSHSHELDYPLKDQERHIALYKEYFWTADDEAGSS